MKRYICAFVFIFLLAAGGRVVLGFEMKPASEIEIRSEYLKAGSGDVVRMIHWKAVSRLGDSNRKQIIVDFFKGEKATGQPVASLGIEEGGRIYFSGAGQNRSWEGVDKFFLLPGYPVPCNVLPDIGRNANKTFKMQKKAGNQKFVNTFTVSSKMISSDFAKTEGWLPANATIENDLVLLTVTDDRNKTVVRQVWAEDGDWWVFEETPYRKSYRRKF